jgi:hypothetical protein
MIMLSITSLTRRRWRRCHVEALQGYQVTKLERYHVRWSQPRRVKTLKNGKPWSVRLPEELEPNWTM